MNSEQDECEKNDFEDREAIRLFLFEYNLRMQRKGRIIQSNSSLFKMVCVDLACSFSFKARKNKEGFYVLKDFKAHTCTQALIYIKNKLIAKNVKLIENTVSGLTPKDCAAYLINNCGIAASYHKAYAGLQLLRVKKVQKEDQSFAMIESWLDDMRQKQAGTGTDYLTRATPLGTFEFEYCAIVFSFAVNAFRNTLPVLLLDACHTKGRYKGVIMVATALTGENKGLIVGCAIAPSENEIYWCRFVQLLKNFLDLDNIADLVIISDRDKGLQNAVENIVPNAAHSYCVAHIERNINSRFRRSCPLIWPAAKTPIVAEFEQYMAQFAVEKGSAVAEYLRSIPSRHWARAHFPVPRFGHITSNVAESINSALSTVRKMHPLNILIGISRIVNAAILKSMSELATLMTQSYQNRLLLSLENCWIILDI
ncbi:hypothetical protein ENBRE01_1683 [Enteropsectra breve]|nr:hypothetical protein ENBRE01_1683 [Enteropsectra breve]